MKRIIAAVLALALLAGCTVVHKEVRPRPRPPQKVIIIR
jgi:acyl-CoA reductase-like NAD-dependent aldehyde dehydrogenase